MAEETFPDICLQTTHQLRIIKAALLYADMVTLCSPIAQILLAVARAGRFNSRQQIELLRMVYPTLSEDNEEADIEEIFQNLEKLLSQKHLSSEGIYLRERLMSGLGKYFDEIKIVAQNFVKNNRIDEFERLVNLGRLSLKPLGPRLRDIDIVAGAVQSSAHFQQLLLEGQTRGAPLDFNKPEYNDAMFQGFLAELEQAVKSSSTYVLLDDFTGNLFRLGLQEGKFLFSELQTSRAKHVGLAANLIERLPLFDHASIDEMIGIQRELNRPLVNFRAAISRFSKEMATAPWEGDFPLEADAIFRSEVQPAVLEIEDAVDNNKYLLELARKLPEKPLQVLGGSALGMALSSLSAMGEVAATVMGVSVGAAVLAAEAWREYVEKRAKIEGHQLFFYYRTKQLLSN